MQRNVENFVDELNALVASVGLQKLAGVTADPGTSHPAEQEPGRSNIQPATTGSFSAENSADIKSDVLGLAVDESKPSDAENGSTSKSTPEKITTANTVGNAPGVEKDYGDAKSRGDYPGTTHPADINKRTEKYSSVKSAADAIMRETAVIKQASVEGLTADNVTEKLGSFLAASEGFANTAENIKAASNQSAVEFLEGYTKSAALIGELAADYLDGMLKQAELEELGGEMAPEAGGDDEAVAQLIEEATAVAAELGVEPEDVLEAALSGDEGGAEMGGEGGVEDAAAAEILETASAIAAELGVEPEEVLEAAIAESEGGLGAGEGEMISPEELAMLSGGGGGAPEGGEAVPMEVVASVINEKDAEINQLRQQLGAFANEKKAAENDQRMSALVGNAMDSWWAKKQTELNSK